MSSVAVDLFAGGGGLTVGLKRANFEVRCAVELDSHAQATYQANHPEVKLLGNIRELHASDIFNTCNASISLLAACPPCQGFCTLTRRSTPDSRNDLVLDVARLVEGLRPRCLMMENVPGLAAKDGLVLFHELIARLRRTGYLVNYGVLQVADFGIPQRRRRLVLLAGRGFEIPLPARTHDIYGRKGLKPWKTVRDALSEANLPEPVPLSYAKQAGGPEGYQWNIVRDISELNLRRLQSAGAGKARACIPVELRPSCHKKSDSGFHNSYGRLAWDQPSVTITAGCTTPSKGRFGHPQLDRTLSVREAAVIQTFPKDYTFKTGHMDKVCQIIGNALPCDFAEIVAKQCYAAISNRGS